jgi:hypothetical protein
MKDTILERARLYARELGFGDVYRIGMRMGPQKLYNVFCIPGNYSDKQKRFSYKTASKKAVLTCKITTKI